MDSKYEKNIFQKPINKKQLEMTCVPEKNSYGKFKE